MRKYTRLLKFCAVGGSGAVLSLALMYIGVGMLGIHYLLNYAITFAIVVAFNYSLNRIWTFSDYKSRGILWFYVGRLGTLFINEVILYLLVDVAGVQYILSTIVAIMVSVVLNYQYSRRKVWTESKAI